MNLRKISIGLIAAAVFAGPLTAVSASAAEVFVPLLIYRTGPYAPNGIPIANGFVDTFTLFNERDGGIEGVKLTWEECETKYNTKIGVECYEKLKSRKPVLVNPYSTGITYQLIPRAIVDGIPILSMGYGNTRSADGRYYPWAFNFPTTYWSQASTVIKYIGQQEGGLDKLKGKKIANVYHNSAYGREPSPTLQLLAKKFGYKLTEFPVDHPGQEQKATWLQIRRLKPDWIFMSGWGVMNQVAIKEAAGIGYPMDHFIGNWWSGTESDVLPAGKGAIGYKAGTFNVPGKGFPIHKDIFKYVYDKGKGAGQRDRVGEVLWNRGMFNAVLSVEGIRTAIKKFGPNVTGKEVRWGFEHLNVTEARLKALGMEGFTKPIKVTCEDHEGNGPLMVQQWTGKEWKVVSGWISPMRDVVRPMIEAEAAKEAKEKGYKKRDCSKEG